MKLFNVEHGKDILYLLAGSKMDLRDDDGIALMGIHHLVHEEMANLLVHGFCRNRIPNEDVIGECFRFYYDANGGFPKEQGMLKAEEIGAVMYAEHSALTQP